MQEAKKTQEPGVRRSDDPMAFGGENFLFNIMIRDAGVEESARSYTGKLTQLPDLSTEGLEIDAYAQITGPDRVLSKFVTIEGRVLSHLSWTEVVADDGVRLEARMIPVDKPASFPHMINYGPVQRRWIKYKSFIENVISARNPKDVAALKSSILYSPIALGVGIAEDLLKVRRCGKCSHFDRKQGADYYSEQTHKDTMAGDRKMNMDIGERLAEEAGVRALNPDKVGLCLTHETLIEDDFEGCVAWRRHG